jgi:hypothetical protein
MDWLYIYGSLYNLNLFAFSTFIFSSCSSLSYFLHPNHHIGQEGEGRGEGNVFVLMMLANHILRDDIRKNQKSIKSNFFFLIPILTNQFLPTSALNFSSIRMTKRVFSEIQNSEWLVPHSEISQCVPSVSLDLIASKELNKTKVER